ncbi:MAG: DNA polymerase III subunit gamma/tau, partial [Ruminococcus sp.]|nr:DNA polymerase III subunit gamma/tau [Candidatus Apopatosoma intestinale]
MYQALYRKWRPTVFEDVVGQAHITSVLKSEVQSGRISHAYLFCGPRGTGKTTCAKIIAKAANCEHPVGGDPCGECAACRSVDTGSCTDVIEMDAASNNGVDAIRDIRDAVVYTPSELKYRVYIIDEVHMLSISAFNALLKTLEEPPEHVIFILATTELHKIPATVLSRCQRFDFHRITPDAMIARMKQVCEGEGFTADEESLALIARLSQGAMRDALNMLEYCASEGGVITIESASRMLGAASTKLLGSLADALASRDAAAALAAVEEIYGSSRDIAVFWRELISFYRDMLIYLSTKGRMGAEKPAASHAAGYTVPVLFSLLEILIAAEGNMQKQPTSAKLYAEMALIRACDPLPTSVASASSAPVSLPRPASVSAAPFPYETSGNSVGRGFTPAENPQNS